MSNQGTKTYTINPGGSQTIPQGYHSGSGTVTANANQNSGTYTFASGNGATVDMGVNNTYRYVNASNVYNKGKADGGATFKTTDLPFTSKSVSGSTSLGSNFVVGTYYFMVSALSANTNQYGGMLTQNSITGGEYTVFKLLMDSYAAGSAGAYIIKATDKSITVHTYGLCTLTCVASLKI